MQIQRANFTQTPNVILYTCSLSDEALMLFNRLTGQVGHRGGIYYGSVRKIAIAFEMKRDKAHRNLKALESAGLICTGIAEDTDASAVQLNLDNLWELNTAYTNGIRIPRWNNLDEALEGVRKIGQSENADEDAKVSEKSDSTVLEIGQSVLNSGQNDRKIGQSVRHRERKVGDNTSKTINTKNTSKKTVGANTPTTTATSQKKVSKPKGNTPPTQKPLIPAITLSDGGQRFYDLYCSLRFIKVPPKVTEDSKVQCDTLAGSGFFKTDQDLYNFKNFMDNHKFFKGKGFSFGMMIHALNDYAVFLDSSRPKEETPPTPEEPQGDEERLIVWNRYGIRMPAELEDHWYMCELMPVREAKQYGYAGREYVSSTRKEIANMLELFPHEIEQKRAAYLAKHAVLVSA